MVLVVLISFAGIVVVKKLIYTTVSREITQFIIEFEPDGPHADESCYLTPHCGISNKCVTQGIQYEADNCAKTDSKIRKLL